MSRSNLYQQLFVKSLIQAQKIQVMHQVEKQNNQQQTVVNSNQSKLTIYSGLLTKKVNLVSFTSNKIFTSSQIVFEPDVDAKVNALKYRHPLKYLGNQYADIVVPCTPAYQLTLISKQKNLSEYECFVKMQKVPSQFLFSKTGIASGKRSAIYQSPNGKLIRFKGCGNEYHGFNKQKNQSRGHHFYHTAKRQLFMTQHINKVMQKSLGINPPANKPIYAFNYDPETLDKLKVVNQLPMINKYCCVFQTQGDRRAGTHLISSLEILFLELIDHQKANWKPIFQQNSRFDNNELVELVANYQLFLDSNSKFLQVYDKSNQIQNYIGLKTQNLPIIQNMQQRLQKVVEKLIPQQEYQIKAMQLLKSIPKQKWIQVIEAIVVRIGFQMGQIKRIMCENQISWGFYLDHGVQWHCNAHLNNFIVTRPQQSQQSKNYFLLPLDYDLSYSSKQFICIDLDSPYYGKSSDQVFQNYLCGQFCAMEMSLFGLQLMNFKYGIGNTQSSTQDIKMSRISFRDTLVSSFNSGMRNKQIMKVQIQQKWDQNIKHIQNLVEACLYLSIEFQT